VQGLKKDPEWLKKKPKEKSQQTQCRFDDDGNEPGKK